MLERRERSSVLLLGVIHFLVDFCCTALLTYLAAGLERSMVITCALVYNGMAFAFQLPIGALGDRLGLQRDLAAAGCLLVGLGGMIPVSLWMCAVIGLGNACFHVGGGREALKRSDARAAQVGRFVAPGAIGIFLGPKLAGLAWDIRPVLLACMAVSAAVLFWTRKTGVEANSLSLPKLGNGRLALVIGCMFATVLLRSYMGTVLRYERLSSALFAAAFTAGIFFGKYFGGSLADRFGTFRFCLFAQVLGTLLFPLSVAWPILALPGIFLFNTTMAVTASRLYSSMPAYPGTMFGLTTFALYIGGVPKILGWPNPLFTPWGLGLLSVLSAVFLLAGLFVQDTENGPWRG